MVPELTRRRLLAGGVAIGTAGVAGATTRIGVGPLDAWTPSIGTWPHDRYDLRNAASNPHASPPSNPTVAWRARPVEHVQSLVVGPERVYVGGRVEDGGSGVAALDRANGELAWSSDVVGSALALRRGTLYAGSSRGESSGLTAFDTETGERRWREAVGDVEGLVALDGTVFAGSHYHLTAVAANSGDTKWTADGGLPAVANGALFASGGGVRRYLPRRISDVLTRESPPVEWDERGGGSLRPPVVSADRAMVGQGLPSHSGGESVYAFDLETGTREWGAVEFSDGEYPVVTGSPAVRRGRGFFSFRRGKQRARSHALVACSLADGTERWRWESSDWVTSVAVGGETVLAGTSADDDTPGVAQNRLLAFAPDGSRKWAFDTEGAVRGLAPVGETVFVGTGVSLAKGTSGVVCALR
ncbi:outer membrane protein assembly factor BamB family protein [Halorussus amylolyticus]|uniref:outer membrane protein assembly factor BamB family protein n=1 Tax=Halorussus amylolyticus TaxID=1126242 RepID=UPI00104AB7CB|nr:PQQ-binding-like beta-propeller repeat protein [Halorussus amylolyticus]